MLIGRANLAEYANELLSMASYGSAELPHIEIQLPKHRVAVRAPHGPLTQAITTTLCSQPDSVESTRKLNVTILHAGIRGIEAPRRWGEDRYLPHEISELLGPHDLRASYFHDFCLWQVMSMDGEAVQLMQGPEAYPPWELGAPLRVFLHWAYAGLGQRLVHAGTLGIDGYGVLLAGSGGAGKSGTVVAGLLSGLESVGDDYVLLDLTDDISAAPLYSTLKQDPAGLARLGLARRFGERPLNWQGKYQFHISDVSDRPMPSKLDLQAVLLPRTGALRTSLEPASARDVLLALAPSTIHQLPGERESGFRFFSALASRLPGYLLHLGPDPEEIASRLRRFIEDRLP